MSLVEATIILSVLALLTSVLAPEIKQFVDDAKRTKAKEDCEAIGVSINRLLKDVASPFLLRDGSAELAVRFQQSNRVDLLVSDGNTPVNDANSKGEGGGGIQAPVFWESQLDLSTRRVDSMNSQLVANSVGYVHPTAVFDTEDPGCNPAFGTCGAGASASPNDQVPQSRGQFGFGWRGAYLSPIVGPDPWGDRYAVNSVYLGATTDTTAGTPDLSGVPAQGRGAIGWASDTICVSAGENQHLEVNFSSTNFGTEFQNTADPQPFNDDIVYVISGFGR